MGPPPAARLKPTVAAYAGGAPTALECRSFCILAAGGCRLGLGRRNLEFFGQVELRIDSMRGFGRTMLSLVNFGKLRRWLRRLFLSGRRASPDESWRRRPKCSDRGLRARSVLDLRLWALRSEWAHSFFLSVQMFEPILRYGCRRRTHHHKAALVNFRGFVLSFGTDSLQFLKGLCDRR